MVLVMSVRATALCTEQKKNGAPAPSSACSSSTVSLTLGSAPGLRPKLSQLCCSSKRIYKELERLLKFWSFSSAPPLTSPPFFIILHVPCDMPRSAQATLICSYGDNRPLQLVFEGYSLGAHSTIPKKRI